MSLARSWDLLPQHAKAVVTRPKDDGTAHVNRREVQLSLNTDGSIVVTDGPLRQPLLDYIAHSDENQEYEVPHRISALEAIDEQDRASFCEVYPANRKEAMQVAVLEAEAREALAREVLAKTMNPMPVSVPFEVATNPLPFEPPPRCETVTTRPRRITWLSPSPTPMRSPPPITAAQPTRAKWAFSPSPPRRQGPSLRGPLITSALLSPQAATRSILSRATSLSRDSRDEALNWSEAAGRHRDPHRVAFRRCASEKSVKVVNSASDQTEIGVLGRGMENVNVGSSSAKQYVSSSSWKAANVDISCGNENVDTANRKDNVYVGSSASRGENRGIGSRASENRAGGRLEQYATVNSACWTADVNVGTYGSAASSKTDGDSCTSDKYVVRSTNDVHVQSMQRSAEERIRTLEAQLAEERRKNADLEALNEELRQKNRDCEARAGDSTVAARKDALIRDMEERLEVVWKLLDDAVMEKRHLLAKLDLAKSKRDAVQRQSVRKASNGGERPSRLSRLYRPK